MRRTLREGGGEHRGIVGVNRGLITGSLRRFESVLVLALFKNFENSLHTLPFFPPLRYKYY